MLRVCCIVFGITLACSSVAVAAQSDPNGNPNAPGNPNILQGVQQLQGSVQQLQLSDVQQTATLQGIQTSLTTIETALKGLTPATSNVLNTTLLTTPVTPATQFTLWDCNWTNLTAETKTVLVELLDSSGFVRTSETQTINPGVSRGISVSNAISARCRFTVQNGTKQDIVANLTRQIMNAPPGGASAVADTAVLPAQ